jgi:hypothetical protein
MTEFKVVILEDATREDMMREQYKLEEMGCDEWCVHDECHEIDRKLDKLNEYKKYRAKCGEGYKNRRR